LKGGEGGVLVVSGFKGKREGEAGKKKKSSIIAIGKKSVISEERG